MLCCLSVEPWPCLNPPACSEQAPKSDPSPEEQAQEHAAPPSHMGVDGQQQLQYAAPPHRENPLPEASGESVPRNDPYVTRPGPLGGALQVHCCCLPCTGRAMRRIVWKSHQHCMCLSWMDSKQGTGACKDQPVIQDLAGAHTLLTCPCTGALVTVYMRACLSGEVQALHNSNRERDATLIWVSSSCSHWPTRLQPYPLGSALLVCLAGPHCAVLAMLPCRAQTPDPVTCLAVGTALPCTRPGPARAFRQLWGVPQGPGGPRHVHHQVHGPPGPVHSCRAAALRECGFFRAPGAPPRPGAPPGPLL